MIWFSKTNGSVMASYRTSSSLMVVLFSFSVVFSGSVGSVDKEGPG